MDTMSLRFQGRPTHPLLMRLLMPVTRFCLAAHLANQDGRTLLGPNGQRLKRLLEWTHLVQVIIWCCVQDPDNFIGAGGQSIVIKPANNSGVIEKYNYTLAGADPLILEQALEQMRKDYRAMEHSFGSLVQPTTFGIAPLPLRWPFNGLATIYTSQKRLEHIRDVFELSQAERAKLYTPEVRKKLKLLAITAHQWADENKWLDIIGPNNVVITDDNGTPEVKIVDTGLYAPEYMSDVNPVVGESYQAVFIKRLKFLEQTLPVFIFGAVATVLVVRHSWAMSHVKAAYDAIDTLEDRFFG